MRDINSLTIKELVEKTPTFEEVLIYFTNWYKERKEKYGGIWRNTYLLNELSNEYLKEFMKINNEIKNDPSFFVLVVEAATELQKTLPTFNAFRNSSYVYTLAKRKAEKQSILV
jgi:hypothetical protein